MGADFDFWYKLAAAMAGFNVLLLGYFGKRYLNKFESRLDDHDKVHQHHNARIAELEYWRKYDRRARSRMVEDGEA